MANEETSLPPQPAAETTTPSPEPPIEPIVAGEPIAAEPTVTAEPAPTPEPPKTDAVADVGKQLSDAGSQVSKSLDTMTPQNRLLLVAVLSFFVGGWLGSILNGQMIKGVAELVGAFVICFLGVFLGSFTFGLGFLLIPLYFVAIFVDAVIIANRKSKGENFGDWDFFIKPAPKV